MRIAILGNSGSGKSTVARWLAEHSGAALLDLDSVAWEPGHRACFDACTGPKIELKSQPSLDLPSVQVLAWLN